MSHNEADPDWDSIRNSSDLDIPQWLRDYESKPAPIRTGSIIQKSKVPAQYADATWLCTECCGYNVQSSGLLLKSSFLDKYKDLVFSTHGIDITARQFFMSLGGYSDEAEERAEAQLVKLIDEHGEVVDTQTEDFGMDITGCVRAILIDDKHREAFKDFTEDELKSRKMLHLYDKGVRTGMIDNTPGIRELALSIRKYAAQNNIPIVLFIPGKTTNAEVLNKIK